VDRNIHYELVRLTINATRKRENLLLTGLKKARRRKALTIVAGILALTSAGTIAAVITKAFGDTGTQLVAALVAAVSGTISLFITSYYSDDEVLAMLVGSAKYLALRENVYRLVIQPNISDEDRFERLTGLQDEYAKLDEAYSRYLSLEVVEDQSNPPMGRVDMAIARSINRAEDAEHEKLHRELEKAGLVDAS
jgi:hypothetical protein